MYKKIILILIISIMLFLLLGYAQEMIADTYGVEAALNQMEINDTSYEQIKEYNQVKNFIELAQIIISVLSIMLIGYIIKKGIEI